MICQQSLDLTRALIAHPSVTPDDAGCQELLSQILKGAGFTCENLRFGQVDNLWATHGSGAPLFVFAGHTDVVPPGNLASWATPPFEPIERNGILYGRGAADMKSGVAAMVVAATRYVASNPNHRGTIALLLTSDEEGDAIDGTVRVVETLKQRGLQIDACVVGEPSSTNHVCDSIKIGRRGSLGGQLRIIGKQGHVAYPHLAKNPIHDLGPALVDLTTHSWGTGDASFPATSFQVSNIHGGTGATNVIPGSVEVTFNFRFGTETTEDDLKETTEKILHRHGVTHDLKWRLSGQPFLTAHGPLLHAAEEAIARVTGSRPELSTAGGTSDGRFIAPTGAQVVEVGVVNATIHQVDECVEIEAIGTLRRVYEEILASYLA